VRFRDLPKASQNVNKDEEDHEQEKQPLETDSYLQRF